MTQTVVEILIDRSGSMGYMARTDGEGDYRIDGFVRMHLVKKMLLENILPMVSDATQVFVRTFRTRSEKKNGVQIDTPEIVPLCNGKLDLIQLSSKIIKIESPAPGGTPITAALKVAEENLKNFPGLDKKIILLTDGEENGGGDFISAANRILDTLDDCKIFVIGIALDRQTEDKILPIATGGYYNILAKDFSTQDVRTKLKFLSENILSDSIEKLQDEKQRIEKLINSGIDSTTLTIDEDYSKELCKITEQLAYSRLCDKFGITNVEWMNEVEESYFSYDFKIKGKDNEVLFYIECKGTPNLKPTFYLTEKEWQFFLNNKEKYFLYRVSNISNTPEIKSYNLLNALLSGELIPMLTKPEILKAGRIFLSIKNVC